MKKIAIITLVALMGLCITGYAVASDKEECVAKCEAAAKAMKDDFVGALAEINKKDGSFVKGSVYVFAMRGGVMIAHPMKPTLIGRDLTHLKDKAGKEFFSEFIKVAKDPGSGWVDYKWPKPGEKDASDKTSYILKVDDNYYVGAGYYK
ncbi:cache domain-containing protein [Desulfobacterales bacterium HSG16]|nr:cache domain-containing protein [Desulfobacterales bacterium HSG16]